MKVLLWAAAILMSSQLAIASGRIPETKLLSTEDTPRLTPPITHFLKQIPNLFGLCTAIKAIPHGIVIQIKEFLESIIDDIPEGNLLRFHFKNVIILIDFYKSVIDTKKELFEQFTDTVQELEEPKPAMFRSLEDDEDDDLDDPLDPFGFVKNVVNPFNPFLKNRGQKESPKKRYSSRQSTKNDNILERTLPWGN